MTLELPIPVGPILLRRYREEDFEVIAGLMGDAAITRYISWGPRDLATARAAFDKRLAADVDSYDIDIYPFAIVDAASGRTAGEAMVMNVEREHYGGEIGFMLHPDFHGKGFAGAAIKDLLRFGFERLELHRLYGVCDDGNIASARAMEKAGLRREAHLLSNKFVKDAWRGTMIFAMLEDEWRATVEAGG